MAVVVTRAKRRVKGKTVDLSSFLGDQNAPSGFAVVTPRRDWADSVEEENDDKYPSSHWKDDKKIVLPTAPKAARGPDFDVSKIPSEPPFTAYIGNLPYDIIDEEIMRFFGNLRVSSVRLPRDGGDRGRMRGFGYAEFESKQDLIEALSLNGETLKNRPVKVSLAGENENDRGDRKNDGIDRTASDWRAGPKSSESFSSRNQKNDNRYEDSDREPYRGRNSYGDDRNRFEGDRSRYDSNRPTYQGRRSTEREYGFGSGDRDRGYNRKFGDGGFDSYDRNRGFDRRNERREDYDFRRDDRDGFNRGGRSEKRDDYEPKRDGFESRHEDEQDRDRPKERTKLQLKPRSVPVEQNSANAAAVSASIFGGAKPVDTAAKEREIELRLAKEKERLEDVPKSKYSNSSEKPKDDRIIKKDASNKYADEPLQENNQARDDSKERSIDEHCTKNEPQYRKTEEENGEPVVNLLANKFAHLPSQED